ncbi:hypothetical protein VNO77_22631 [Canavalia gladiata]|uniref:Uncharacterized protein n=1 Tax=Canavalia gladiata TaxID=3824 RepID=A0AAN9L5K1_CANGL
MAFNFTHHPLLLILNLVLLYCNIQFISASRLLLDENRTPTGLMGADIVSFAPLFPNPTTPISIPLFPTLPPLPFFQPPASSFNTPTFSLPPLPPLPKLPPLPSLPSMPTIPSTMPSFPFNPSGSSSLDFVHSVQHGENATP